MLEKKIPGAAILFAAGLSCVVLPPEPLLCQPIFPTPSKGHHTWHSNSQSRLCSSSHLSALAVTMKRHLQVQQGSLQRDSDVTASLTTPYQDSLQFALVWLSLQQFFTGRRKHWTPSPANHGQCFPRSLVLGCHSSLWKQIPHLWLRGREVFGLSD